MPLLASIAVALCTAMVLVTWSVMGGFLNMLINSGRTMVGDVVIAWPNTGFAYYDDLIERLRKDPLVSEATPVVETFAMAGLPDGRTEVVLVKGIDPVGFAKVTKFAEILWWKPIDTPLPKDKDGDDPRLVKENHPALSRIHQNGLRLERADDPARPPRPAVVMGIEVAQQSTRWPEGFYTRRPLQRAMPDGSIEVNRDFFMPINGSVTLNLLPIDAGGRPVEAVTQTFPVANEFQSNVYDIDSKVILMPLESAQRMLKMNRSGRIDSAPGSPARVVVDPVTGEERIQLPGSGGGETPARVTQVQVRGVGDLVGRGKARPLQERCREIYREFAAAHPGAVPDEVYMHRQIRTWEEINGTLIGAVEHETALVLFLFVMISFVAVFLVLAIFWSMVSEKTRDIGTLRAIGASRGGIAGVWLTYGFAIGLTGSLLGLAVAYALVININPIHEWMGRALGIQIWNPEVYYFTRIPNQVNPVHAMVVMAGGVFSSVLGALIPAIRAAGMHPVHALRFE